MLNAGVSVIYQELNLINHLSIAENVFLGREPRRAGGLIDWKSMHRHVKELLDQFKVDLDPKATGAHHQSRLSAGGGNRESPVP